MTNSQSFSAFHQSRRIALGSRAEVIRVLRDLAREAPGEPVLIFDNATGRQVDFALDEVEAPQESEPRQRGRPKLGVVAREVTLLPRHWDWLNAQPGGASVALRKLVDAARKANAFDDFARQASDATCRFLSAIAGNAPFYEEAVRALYAGRSADFAALIRDWPEDIADLALKMSEGRFLEGISGDGGPEAG